MNEACACVDNTAIYFWEFVARGFLVLVMLAVVGVACWHCTQNREPPPNHLSGIHYFWCAFEALTKACGAAVLLCTAVHRGGCSVACIM